MNKKLCLMFVAVAGLIFAPLTISAEPSANGYYTSDHSSASTGLAAVTTDPTEIRVTNGRNDTIFIAAPLKDNVDSGTNKFIRHLKDTVDVHVILKDQRDNTIFDGVVCRYALITVYGDPNSNGSHVTRVKC